MLGEFVRGAELRRTVYSPTGSAICSWCNDQLVGQTLGAQQGDVGVAIAAAGSNPRADGPNRILAWIRKALGRDQR